MKRIIFMVIRNIFVVPYLWIKLHYYAAHEEKYSDEQKRDMLKKIVYHANKGGNIIIDSVGQENIPKEQGFIFYPNHQGLYDVLAVIDACPFLFSVVSKKEVANVPVLKQTFKILKAYIIDREDIRQSMEIINSIAKDVSKGKNFLIFAEGTRSKKGNQLNDFKGGSFKAAVKSKCPIVPLVIYDAYKAFDTNSIEKIIVKIRFLEPLVYEEYKDMKTVEIAKKVKLIIENKIEELNSEN